jgi:CRP-like cAMP-binding protein
VLYNTNRPLQRDVGEVKQLSNHLSHFPSLLPPSDKDGTSVLVGVAARCLLETIPKKGFSLPDKGGVYLILQGSVERKTNDEATQEIISTQLHEGDSFGAMEENFITKPSYPMYATSSRCALMRMTAFDYQRVLQNCEAAERRERLALINSCPALSGVSSSVTGAMASDIHWETIPPNTILMDEGERIARVGFIQTGSCTASMAVPQARPGAQLMIGRLGPGSCVGEALLRGSERQPYKVQTDSRVRIGWVSSTTVTMNEVGKLIPADKELSIPVPTKDTVRHQYAKELMALHWRKIKSDILSEARGDQVPQPEPVSRWKI